MGLARCARHGGHLHLHLAAQGRLGAPAGPAALREHAQILAPTDWLRAAAGVGALSLVASADAGPRPLGGQKIQAIISQNTTKKMRKPAMVNGSSPKIASPPETTAITRIATKETANEINAAVLSPSPSEKGSPSVPIPAK